ncbi:MAG: hypothetical protein CVV27_13885 [Candidatus Melainabacteria bacterium HGW-Melainabacteria-1]|nr:MAG: hypothetical protein CVV27_13885 [Candidatus Melainabacteria bacterium HGW-Melainabacteria-1]
MAFNPLKEKGIPLEEQARNWRAVAMNPYNKNTVDAHTRSRNIMNGQEVECTQFSHNFARVCVDDAQ